VVYIKEEEIARKAVIEAAKLCSAVRAEMVGADSLEKEDRSPVTVADFGAQALICRRLRSAFPNDAIVAEEDSADLRRSENGSRLAQVTRYVGQLRADTTRDQVCEWIDYGKGTVTDRFWTLDPIDGTKGFLRNDQYAVALALIESKQVQVGVLACPALPLNLEQPELNVGVLFIAVRGAGAVMAPLDGGDRVSIEPVEESKPTHLRFVESVEASHGNQPLQRAIAQAVGITQPSLRMDSQAKYGAVARGDAALYLRLPSPESPDYREKIWDHAAGALIVQEAGGRVTDMYGQPLDFASDYRMNDNLGVVVSNGSMHRAVIEAITQHYG
jgi:3'(2'), 5'-bisphosphate nucleotidase